MLQHICLSLVPWHSSNHHGIAHLYC